SPVRTAKRSKALSWLAIVVSATVCLGAAPTPTQQAPQPAPFGAVFLHKGAPPNLPKPILSQVKKHYDKFEYAVIPTGGASYYAAFFRNKCTTSSAPILSSISKPFSASAVWSFSGTRSPAT
ncbi:MAG TPA: hypothetical protein VKA53_02480, partial [Thermoanaerobaculia bacterium]|nr:hypothetical protein [Thermoanaerobaculia bacterium]